MVKAKRGKDVPDRDDTVSAKDLRERAGDILNRVRYQRRWVKVTKYGTPVAAIVPYEYLQLLQRQVQRRDDEGDAASVRERIVGGQLMDLDEFLEEAQKLEGVEIDADAKGRDDVTDIREFSGRGRSRRGITEDGADNVTEDKEKHREEKNQGG